MLFAAELQPGELLYSFLLRRIICSGRVSRYDDLKAILASNGKWPGIPKIPKRYQAIFDPIAWHDKVDAVRCNTALWANEAILNPIHLHSFVSSIFSGMRLDRGLSQFEIPNPVVYCPTCFTQQLCQSGFTWFKANWLKRPLCPKHRTPLVAGGCRNCGAFTNMYKYFLATVTGICPRCGCKTWENATPASTPQQPDRDLAASKSKRVKLHSSLGFTPCYMWTVTNLLLPSLIRALFRQPQTETASTKKLVHIYTFGLRDGKGHSQMSSAETYILCDRLENTNHPTLSSWISSKAEVVTLNLPPAASDAPRDVKFRTLRNRPCKTCTISALACPLQPNKQATQKTKEIEQRTFLTASEEQNEETVRPVFKHHRPHLYEL